MNKKRRRTNSMRLSLVSSNRKKTPEFENEIFVNVDPLILLIFLSSRKKCARFEFVTYDSCTKKVKLSAFF